MMAVVSPMLASFALKIRCQCLGSFHLSSMPSSTQLLSKVKCWARRPLLLEKRVSDSGAPHYHVLLWIRDAPMIGRDDPSKVFAWIEERITCHIPDQENNPELHNLVTRYQLHKCSNYCKRKRKRGKTFVTTCKFGFPREPSESPKVHCVEEKLKKRQKIYQISRTEAEVRVNDYNPLLLLLWKANMDIQFVSESSLALAHYVSGYVTKAERSNMSEIWQEVSESKTIYGRLWSFGVHMLRSRECGLYEASDLLLGDHLFEKSDAVQWIEVSMPHKLNRRLKDYSELLEMESTDPECENIFKENLYSNYYPDRPEELQDLCLHDFVANFDWYGKDSKGQRKYCKLGKPRLVNHQIFDPEKEDHREDYFYSLILLFVPFRDEASLLNGNERQRLACSLGSIPFACSNKVRQGGAAVVLKRPQNTQNIRGDGNCLFRAFSYLITGNQTHYHGVRLAIVTHMRSIQTFIISNGYTSVEQYVSETGMNRTSVWGTEIEILTLAHLLSTPVLVYAAGNNDWVRYSPSMITTGMHDNVDQKSMYIRHSNSHFDVVLSIR